MAEAKKTTGAKKETEKKPVAQTTKNQKNKTKDAPKKNKTTKKVTEQKKGTTNNANKTIKSNPVRKNNLSNAEQSFKLSKDAMFNVWIDALILVFVVLMFVLILYGYVMSA